MTDRERAEALAEALLGGRVVFKVQDSAAVRLTAEFEAVRAEERRAVVAYLRTASNGLARHAADQIERGHHTEAN